MFDTTSEDRDRGVRDGGDEVQGACVAHVQEGTYGILKVFEIWATMSQL